ncbi:MAG: F0F1 ATP synthase subunit B [Propionibacteriaceae bacterium]|jgi:F-type H+-transporting ATPase subunit b|nr:F0F1 ATP synthase subunit B [Propionibacteriaceae bacterium]
MLPLELNLGPLLPEHLSEIFVGIALFLIVWFVVAKKVVPMFEATYAERTEAIAGGIEKAERAQAQAAAALKEYQEKLANARQEAADIRAQAQAQAADIAAEIKAQAAEESQRMIASAKQAIEAEKAAALRELRGEIGGLATNLAGRLVGESLEDDDRIRRSVDRFLDELDSQKV